MKDYLYDSGDKLNFLIFNEILNSFISRRKYTHYWHNSVFNLHVFNFEKIKKNIVIFIASKIKYVGRNKIVNVTISFIWSNLQSLYSYC